MLALGKSQWLPKGPGCRVEATCFYNWHPNRDRHGMIFMIYATRSGSVHGGHTPSLSAQAQEPQTSRAWRNLMCFNSRHKSRASLRDPHHTHPPPPSATIDIRRYITCEPYPPHLHSTLTSSRSLSLAFTFQTLSYRVYSPSRKRFPITLPCTTLCLDIEQSLGRGSVLAPVVDSVIYTSRASRTSSTTSDILKHT